MTGCTSRQPDCDNNQWCVAMVRSRKAPSPKQVKSAEINEFIKQHAHEEDNIRSLRERIQRELGVTLSVHAVGDRCSRMEVKTKNLRTRHHDPVYQVSTLEVQPQDPIAQQVLSTIKRRKNVLTVEDLANLLVTSPANIRRAVKALKEGGHNVVIAGDGIELSTDIPKADPFRIDVRKLEGKTFKFGVTGDNHLCSRYARLDVLNALFDIWADEGVTTVYQLGNMIEGDAPFNKHETVCRGLEAQSKYFVENWPQRKGITTHFITGDDHEGWYTQREGVDVGRYIQNQADNVGRSDLKYLGHMEHDILLTGKKQRSFMRLIHAGGGSAYATSYAPQKIVESYQGGEKPNVLLIGHYHKAEYGYPREVHTLQVGCTCDQTSFMRKNKIQAHIGGWTCELMLNDAGLITRFKQEWMPFYDRGFYDTAWRQRFLG